MEEKNSFQHLDEKAQADNLLNKIDYLSVQLKYVLEGLVNVLKTLDAIEKKQNTFENQIASIQRTVSRNQSYTRDLIMINNNIQSDVDDLKDNDNEMHSKLDVLDNDINNVKIFKYVSS